MNRIESKYLVTACALVVAAMSGTAQAELLVDRGLPTANLNATDSTRSNVAWTDGGQTAATPTPASYYVEGDTFTNTSTSTWLVNTIRIWTVGPFDANSLTLLGGTVGPVASFATISSGYTSTATTYAGGASYISGSGSSLALTEIDFSVNLTLAAGEQFVYFLNGTGGRYVVPFMSASNAAFSGSPQDQADGLIWEANVADGSIVSFDSFSTLGNGWDKVSDFNVQVSGSTVPEPGSVMLVGIGLMGAVFARRRKS
jgi:hypothetical protein